MCPHSLTSKRIGENRSLITFGNPLIIPDGHNQENAEFPLWLESGKKFTIHHFPARVLVIAHEIVYFQYFFETIECNTMQSEYLKSHLNLY